MIEIPKEYEIGKRIPIKDFIPLSLTPDIRKKVKEIVKKVVLTYQISGEQIPSVRDEMYDSRLIQFYDFEVNDIKRAKYISEIYQKLIKSSCIIRIYDKNMEVYSFGLKRLNQNNRDEIVLEDSFITDSFNKILPSLEKRALEKTISFEKIINKTNKVNFYLEIYTKAFILKYQKLYMNSKKLLEAPIWYNEKSIREVCRVFREMVRLREKLDKATVSSEKVKYTQELKGIMESLEKI